jgi:L-threonylcarbamoyladenylate synthase
MTKDKVIKILQAGGVGVLATDTIYGLVGQALAPLTVEKIYNLRQRHPDKPLIILIGSLVDLDLFKIKISSWQRDNLSKLWPGQVSVVLPCANRRLAYLHRGTKTLAFRLPAKPDLLDILKLAGPLVAPSANLEGSPPAKNILEAKKYFGGQLDFYLDAGELSAEPSTLVSLIGEKMEILRPGAVKLKV